MTAEQDAVAALRRSGWSEGRLVAIDADRAALEGDGYAIWPGLLDILREFSGLTIQFIRGGWDDTIWVSAQRACVWAERDWVVEYESRLGVRLAPIGYAYFDHLLLLAAEDGRFFGTYDDSVTPLGSSPIEMVDMLLHERGAPLPRP